MSSLLEQANEEISRGLRGGRTVGQMMQGFDVRKIGASAEAVQEFAAKFGYSPESYKKAYWHAIGLGDSVATVADGASTPDALWTAQPGQPFLPAFFCAPSLSAQNGVDVTFGKIGQFDIISGRVALATFSEVATIWDAKIEDISIPLPAITSAQKLVMRVENNSGEAIPIQACWIGLMLWS